MQQKESFYKKGFRIITSEKRATISRIMAIFIFVIQEIMEARIEKSRCMI